MGIEFSLRILSLGKIFFDISLLKTHGASLLSSSYFCRKNRYMEIPIVSRIYLTSAFLTTAGCAMDIISPYNLYFNFDLIFFEGQVWRLFSSFMFFGLFSVDFLFHMYFVVSLIHLVMFSFGTLHFP